MITVQIDVKLRPEDDDTTAIWLGEWPQVPTAGHTFEIRPEPGTRPGHECRMYRVTGVHWVVFDAGLRLGPEVTSATVFAEPWTPA